MFLRFILRNAAYGVGLREVPHLGRHEPRKDPWSP